VRAVDRGARRRGDRDDRGEHHEIDSHAGESGAGLAVDHAEDGEHEDERTHELGGERLSRARRIAVRGDAETDVPDVKHDLQARPIYHHQRDSIEAHLTIVFAALAVSHWIARYRTIEIQAGAHTITAADPLSDDLRQALDRINRRPGAH